MTSGSVVTKATGHYRPSLSVDGRPHTVIGVIAAQFAFFPRNHKSLIPRAGSSKKMPERKRGLFVVGRLKRASAWAGAPGRASAVGATDCG